MVRKVVAKPISKSKAAKKTTKDEAIQSLVLRQSYIPLEIDEQLRKLVQLRGVRMNELIRGMIEDSVFRMNVVSPSFEIEKTPEPEIDFYVQELHANDGWVSLFMTQSEEVARDFIKTLDRDDHPGSIRLVRTSLEPIVIEENEVIENKA